MNQRFDELMYHAGLTAQGCWDEMDDYDRQAIEKFAELIVQECADIAFAKITKDGEAVVVSNAILDSFGVER